MKKMVIIFLALFYSHIGLANVDEIRITGKLIVLDGDLSESIIELRSLYGGVKNIPLTSNGKFSIDLPKNQVFHLKFSKKGYIVKEVKVDTHVEKNVKTDKVNFDVKLFPQHSNSSQLVYLEPVGTITFIQASGLVDINYRYKLGLIPIRVEL